LDKLDGITVRDLRSLVALADRLHFGRAAADLSIAQPSLSAMVQKVERLLGELDEQTPVEHDVGPAQKQYPTVLQLDPSAATATHPR